MQFRLNSFKDAKREFSKIKAGRIDRDRVGKSWAERKHFPGGHIEPYWQDRLIAAHVPGDQSC